MAREEWRSCAEWLVSCQILAADHKVNWANAQVFDLAQVLRDGVLICHLLNRLKPGAIDPKDFSQRPQMSQFLCLKNIRVFLQTCKVLFSMKENDLFDPYDLFDMKNFGKVIQTLSKLSRTLTAKESGIPGFTVGRSGDYESLPELAIGFSIVVAQDEDIYQALPEKAMGSNIPDDEVSYDAVCEEDQHEIYEDLCAFRRRPSIQGPSDSARTKRDYCIKELVETEKNYVDALNMIQLHFMKPLFNHLRHEQWETIFFGIKELYEYHSGFHTDLNKACSVQHNNFASSALTIPDCFIKWKEKFLVYGDFCSNLPKAQEVVDDLQKNPHIQSEIHTCQMKANQGKFRLRDLLSVPMQRVLKYHLLLKELIKQTDAGHPERKALERALEEMQDLSLYVNEVKRDNEALHLINEIQNSIVDLQMPDDTLLKDYGRLLKDGELKVKPHDDKSRNRYIFLFDKVMLMCKSRMVDKFLASGETYNYKTALILSHYKVSENTQARADKGREFLLYQRDGQMAYTMTAKTDDIKRKWIDAIHMAHDNTSPQGARENRKDFVMFSYDKPTTCDVCHKLLRGVFYQGYRCNKTSLNVHKECIRKAINMTGRPTIPPKSDKSTGLPPPTPTRPDPMNGGLVYRPAIAKVKGCYAYKGIPAPPDGRPVIEFDVNDVFDLLVESEENWFEGRSPSGKEGFFPSSYVQVTRRLTNRLPSYEQSQPAPNQRYTPSPVGKANGSLPSPIAHGASSTSYVNITDLDQFSWGISYETPTLMPPNTPRPSGPDYENEREIERLAATPVDLNAFPWFTGKMARDVASRKLEPLMSGTYLIRESVQPQRVGEYALSIKFGSGVKHIKVQRSPDGMFFLAECKMFRSITELVDYYRENTLEKSFPEVASTLLTAYKDAMKMLEGGKGAEGPAGGVLGYCTAQYDYAANQLNQLSLKVEDRIAILSKAGGSMGWWKGTCNGKTGYFPSAYVLEE